MNNRIIIKINNPLEFIAVLIVGFMFCGLILYSFIDNPEQKTNNTTMGAFICGAIFIMFGILGLVFRWKRKVAVNTNGMVYKLYKKNKLNFIIYTSLIFSFFLYISLLTINFVFKSNMYYIITDINNIYYILVCYLFCGILCALYKYKQYREIEKYLELSHNI